MTYQSPGARRSAAFISATGSTAPPRPRGASSAAASSDSGAPSSSAFFVDDHVVSVLVDNQVVGDCAVSGLRSDRVIGYMLLRCGLNCVVLGGAHWRTRFLSLHFCVRGQPNSHLTPLMNARSNPKTYATMKETKTRTIVV